jgi:hypothetical protein
MKDIRNTMNNQTLPIIAVTADVMTSTKESLLEIGFNDVVSKPFTIDQIHATIAQCVHIDSDKTLENDNGNTEAHIDIENDKELTIHSIVSYLLTLPHNQKEALFAAMELQDFDEMLRIGNTEITPTLSMSTILKRFQSAAELYDYKFFSKLLEEYSRNKS